MVALMLTIPLMTRSRVTFQRSALDSATGKSNPSELGDTEGRGGSREDVVTVEEEEEGIDDVARDMVADKESDRDMEWTQEISWGLNSYLTDLFVFVQCSVQRMLVGLLYRTDSQGKADRICENCGNTLKEKNRIEYNSDERRRWYVMK
jgi:hypothetical protein